MIGLIPGQTSIEDWLSASLLVSWRGFSCIAPSSALRHKSQEAMFAPLRSQDCRSGG